jgi:alcohol dehydrogenase class IV
MAHGLSNAILLPSVMAFNQSGNEVRFAAMARAMGLAVEGLSEAAAADAFVQALRQLNTDLKIPNSLKGFGIAAADIDGLVEGASKVTRLLDNNPRAIGPEDMRAIYAALL